MTKQTFLLLSRVEVPRIALEHGIAVVHDVIDHVTIVIVIRVVLLVARCRNGVGDVAWDVQVDVVLKYIYIYIRIYILEYINL